MQAVTRSSLEGGTGQSATSWEAGRELTLLGSFQKPLEDFEDVRDCGLPRLLVGWVISHTRKEASRLLVTYGGQGRRLSGIWTDGNTK